MNAADAIRRNLDTALARKDCSPVFRKFYEFLIDGRPRGINEESFAVVMTFATEIVVMDVSAAALMSALIEASKSNSTNRNRTNKKGPALHR